MFVRNLLLALCLVLVSVTALQPVSNRRSFVNQFVAGTAGAAVSATTTSSAWAADDITKAYQKNKSKGADSTPAPAAKQAGPNAEGSLLEKMGVANVPGAAESSSAYKGQGYKSYSGVRTVYGSV